MKLPKFVDNSSLTAQEAVPTEDELDEAWKSGFNAGFGEAKLTTNPPQPSVSVAELVDGDGNELQHPYARGWNAALRALKGGDANG